MNFNQERTRMEGAQVTKKRIEIEELGHVVGIEALGTPWDEVRVAAVKKALAEAPNPEELKTNPVRLFELVRSALEDVAKDGDSA